MGQNDSFVFFVFEALKVKWVKFCFLLNLIILQQLNISYAAMFILLIGVFVCLE